VAVKIRLKRFGKIRAPYYRIVVADSRTKRDGRVIEEIGKYHPTEEPSLIEVDSARAQYWLGVGAQPTEQALVLLKITGDWQTFKGLPGTEGTLRTKAGSADTAVVVKAAADAAEKAKAKASAAKEAAAKEAKEAKDKAAAAAAAEAAAATAAEAAAAAAQEAPAEAAPAEEAPAEEAPAAEAAPADATDEQA
jgi:small subunit ribosomal protein S16